MVNDQMARNVLTQGCGCAFWDELQDGRWVHRIWLCYSHEETAASD